MALRRPPTAPVRVLGILDPERAQVVVAAPKGPFDGAVVYLQGRVPSTPFLPATVTRGRLTRSRMDERGRGSGAVDGSAPRCTVGAPLARAAERHVGSEVRPLRLDSAPSAGTTTLPDVLPGPPT